MRRSTTSSRLSSNSAITKRRGELERATLSAVWSQWRAIGASANVTPATMIVDPEALILMSLFAQDREPRLRDITYAWFERNEALLSVRRLRTLADIYPAAVAERLGEFALVATRLAKHPRWAELRDDRDHHESPMEQFATARATEPALEAPPALMLRMRAALGVGAKADVLAYLLGQVERSRPDSTTVRAIAKATRYTMVATRSALQDLTSARFILGSDERPRTFVAPPQSWRGLLDLAELPRWWPWNQIYAFACEYLDWTSRRTREVSDSVLRIREEEMLDTYPAVKQLVADFPASSTAYLPGATPGPVEVLTAWIGIPGAV
jgi:hypothetical protein